MIVDHEELTEWAHVVVANLKRPIRLEIAAELPYGPCPAPDNCAEGGECGVEVVARVYLREPRCQPDSDGYYHANMASACECGPLAEKRIA